MSIYFLDKKIAFPNPVNTDSSGLLAIGGDLQPERIILAYQNGIFPWYSESEPVHWWSPDPRMVMFPDDLKISKSMKQVIHKNQFIWTYNRAFESVIDHCARQPRRGQDGTWITKEMKEAYIKLNKSGIAHSVEVWADDELVGGLYGLLLGQVFYGESMFSIESNASKYGFIHWVQFLKEKGLKLIDCQIYTPHMESLGAKTIPREKFIVMLNRDVFGKQLKV
jgi:leucyl/phenylalanyl-tRNA---protein transferase